MIWFRYVPHDLVGRFLASGWTIADDFVGCHHGRHAVLMLWDGSHEPN